jgi:TP901 family phage tail tape measure protein
VSVVANVAINVDSSNAVSKLRQVNDAGSKLEQTFKGVDGKLRDSSGRFIKLGDSAQASTGKINVLARALSNLGTGLAVADVARRYFKGFNEAEKAAAAVRTLGVDSKALEGNLLGLSQKLGGLYSQTQLLTAAYDVASSGFANAADNTKVLEAAAKGATGGLSDINTVGNAVTSVLNAYGKSADEAASLVDGFIQTQNDGKIILNEYAGLIGRLAPTAKAAGVGINEMNAAIATITAQGVPVEATFTGLNQALVSILKPSQEAVELAKSLGIQFNEAGLRAKGFGGLLEEVKTKTGGSTTQLVKLFGSVDALKAILPLVNDDLVKYNENVVKQANASGVAEKATQELGGTVSSEITKMINQIGNLTRALDTVLGPSLGGIVRLINFVIAEATKGIQVLGQLFSMSPNKMIAQQAVRSGQIGAAPRTLAGIDETIGEKRRKALQQQAGAGTGFLGLGMNTEKFIKLLQQQPEFKSPVTASNKPAAVVDPALQALLDKLAAGGGSGGGRTAGGGGASKAADEAKRLAEELQRSVERGNDLFRQFSRQAVLLGITSETERKRLQIQYEYQDRVREINELKDAEQKVNLMAVNDEIRRLQTLELQTEELKKQLEVFYELAGLSMGGMLPGGAGAFRTDVSLDPNDRAQQKIDEYKTKLTELQDPINMAQRGAQGIGDAFASSFQGIMTGTQTAQEALASFFQNIAKSFLDMATEIIAQMVIMYAFKQLLGLFGGGAGIAPSNNFSGAFSGTTASFNPSSFGMGLFPGRAAGGPVSSGQTYMVGERGPELFVPGRSGTIVANDKMGGGNTNVVVNVDAKGSSVEGDEQGANQLGRVISAAVQSELIKQQRPGGILAR